MYNEERIADIKTELIDDMVRLVENWGLSGLVGRIYSILLFSSEPLSMDEISKASGYSVSSICQQMPFLENVGNVKRTKRPGSKKIYFEAERDMATLLTKRISHGLEHSIIPTITTMERAINEYNELKENRENHKLSKKLKKDISRTEHLIDDLTKIEKFYTNILNISIEKLLKEERR